MEKLPIENKLPAGWSKPKLEHLCEVVRGGSPRPMGTPRYFAGDIPFIKIADITKTKNKIIYDAVTKVNKEGAKKKPPTKERRINFEYFPFLRQVHRHLSGILMKFHNSHST
ncbi:MAG: restriction endonuclease subunit S [bacterium]|nr:restriction endonuclease subunit S [bacterium]